MSQSLTGSRYDLHITHQGAAEGKMHDYYAVLPGDTEEPASGRRHDRLRALVGGGQHRRRPRHALRRLPDRLPSPLPVLPQSGYLAQAQRPPRTVSRAMHEIGKYAKVLKISRGGITLSGGEPMVQRAFMMQIFRRCKQLGLHTCVDTSGRLGDRMTDEDLMQIDLNLLDIKSGDPAVYEQVTRHPLQPTLDYAQRLSALGRPMWIRFVLTPGLTDGWDNVEKIADICAGLARRSSAWKSCAFTRWAATSGTSSAFTTRWKTSNRRIPN